MNHIGIEAISAISGDPSGLNLVWLAALLALVLLIWAISSKVIRKRSLAVRHLFLKVKMKDGDTQHTGFIRTLDLDSATLVTSFAPNPHSPVSLDLSSLPDFPANQTTVQGRVRSVKSLGGQPSNFLIFVKFAKDAHNTNTLTPLAAYLRHLHA